MNDFVAELEAELVAAARRKAGRRRRPALPRLRLAPLVAAAVLAALAVVGVRALDWTRPADDRAMTPGAGVEIALRAGVPTAACAAISPRSVPTSPRARARCFSDDAIESGRAIALAGPGMVRGIAPDGVDRVRLDWRGGSVSVDVTKNAYVAQLPGAREGDVVQVALAGPAVDGADCAPSEELYEAAPALRSAAAEPLPDGVTMPEAGVASRRHSRRVWTAGDLELWVVPVLPCDRGRGQETVCVVAALDTGSTATCNRPANVRRRGMWLWGPEGGPAVVAGLAATGADRAVLTSGDVSPHVVTVTDGVFATVLPKRFTTSGVPTKVDFFRGSDVWVLNATTVDGLATEFGERLRQVDGLEPSIGNFSDQRRKTSTVFFADPTVRELAELVAATAGIADVLPAPANAIWLPPASEIVVVVGADQMP